MVQFELLWARYEAATQRTRRAHALGVEAPYAWADYRSAKREVEEFVQATPGFADEYFDRIQALNRK